MTTNHHQQSRREMLKTTTLGVGLFMAGQIPCAAQYGRGRYGRQNTPTEQGHSGGRKGLPLPLHRDNPSIQHLRRNCRKCGRCREFCQNVTTVFGHPVPVNEEACIHCGQCTLYCKANALDEQYHYPRVSKAIADSQKIVVASTSPAIRVALGEMFGMSPGTNVEGKTVGALKKLGIDHVLDTTFSADLTVMEEAAELIKRLESKESMPMFTSCCPAWVRFARLFYPKLLPHLSTAKSPILMQGAMVKTYFAEKQGLDPERIFHVALAPCTAKKAEILLPGMNAAGIWHKKPAMHDVDVVLTTRELGYLLQESRIDLSRQAEAAYDSLMGAGSGAGMIFGNTGGVTEAALRTAFWMLNGTAPPKEFYQLQKVRGLESVREATVDLGKAKLNIALVHGIGQSRPLLEAIQQGETRYDFIEVMACPGGCIGGGGQPRDHEADANLLKQQRASALWHRDTDAAMRLSYENAEIKAVYENFLGKPLGDLSETLLHISQR